MVEFPGTLSYLLCFSIKAAQRVLGLRAKLTAFCVSTVCVWVDITHDAET